MHDRYARDVFGGMQRVVTVAAEHEIEARYGTAEIAIGSQAQMREDDERRIVRRRPGHFARDRERIEEAPTEGALPRTAFGILHDEQREDAQFPGVAPQRDLPDEGQRPVAYVDEIGADERLRERARARAASNAKI